MPHWVLLDPAPYAKEPERTLTYLCFQIRQTSGKGCGSKVVLWTPACLSRGKNLERTGLFRYTGAGKNWWKPSLLVGKFQHTFGTGRMSLYTVEREKLHQSLPDPEWHRLGLSCQVLAASPVEKTESYEWVPHCPSFAGHGSRNPFPSSSTQRQDIPQWGEGGEREGNR